MFDSNKAFAGFSVNDLDAARRFYGETMGLKLEDHPIGFLHLHVGGGNPLTVYPKPDHKAATYTVLNFPVDDIEAAVDYLIDKGIAFEQYSGSIETDEKGISRGDMGPAIAWFRDPAGNILSVIEM